MNRGAGLGFHGIGRLKPGVTVEQARADMDEVTRNLASAFSDTDRNISPNVVPLKERMWAMFGRFWSCFSPRSALFCLSPA